MNIASAFSAELDHEAVATRKHLERIPADKLGFKPHVKSMSLVQLASHLCEIWNWGLAVVQMDEFKFDPETYKPWVAETSVELIGAYDKGLAGFKVALACVDDAAMMKPWKLIKGDQVMFEMPRVVALRSMILNHSVHHRAQLGLYLRLLDLPVPMTYGPSADEGKM